MSSGIKLLMRTHLLVAQQEKKCTNNDDEDGSDNKTGRRKYNDGWCWGEGVLGRKEMGGRWGGGGLGTEGNGWEVGGGSWDGRKWVGGGGGGHGTDGNGWEVGGGSWDGRKWVGGGGGHGTEGNGWEVGGGSWDGRKWVGGGGGGHGTEGNGWEVGGGVMGRKEMGGRLPETLAMPNEYCFIDISTINLLYRSHAPNLSQIPALHYNTEGAIFEEHMWLFIPAFLWLRYFQKFSRQ